MSLSVLGDLETDWEQGWDRLESPRGQASYLHSKLGLIASTGSGSKSGQSEVRFVFAAFYFESANKQVKDTPRVRDAHE